MSQEQTNKQTSETDEDYEAEPVKINTEELDEDVDDLLADIDDVLETNAEEFVKGYQQKGGE